MIKREIEIARAEAAKKEKERLAAEKLAKAAAAKKTEDSKTPAETITKSEENNATPIAKTMKPAPVVTKSTGSSVLVSSDADKALNASFERNKGSLPWPVNGFVVSHFGTNQLPGGIDYYNPGVSIGCKSG